jgi:hypothetical protein
MEVMAQMRTHIVGMGTTGMDTMAVAIGENFSNDKIANNCFACFGNHNNFMFSLVWFSFEFRLLPSSSYHAEANENA